ncbi:MAG: restriction endonuclease subunit S [Rubrobacteraceae bacterium]
MGHIKRHHLTDALALVPPEATIQAMDATMAPVMEKVFVNRLEACTLASIRDALLPRLISGELRVGETETLVEDAV